MSAGAAKLARQVPEIDRDHVFVRFRSRPADLGKRLATAGAAIDQAVEGTSWTALSTHGDAIGVRSRLQRDPTISQVTYSYIRHANAVPNDVKWASSQKSYLGPLRVDRAWDASPTKGANITVAVVDTGVDQQHPDLAGRVLSGTNIAPTTNSVQDDNGHGTMVAGIIAADMNNLRGIAGIAPQAKILPVKVLDAGGGGNDVDIANGIKWAADHGAKVINLSLGGAGDDPVLDQQVNYALAHDVVVVSAAGNDGSETVGYPAAIPGVIAVSATTHGNALTAFSSYGSRIDIAAPGLDITSTALGVPPSADTYATESGTSFASPIVSGVAALVRAQHAGMDASTSCRPTAEHRPRHRAARHRPRVRARHGRPVGRVGRSRARAASRALDGWRRAEQHARHRDPIEPREHAQRVDRTRDRRGLVRHHPRQRLVQRARSARCRRPRSRHATDRPAVRQCASFPCLAGVLGLRSHVQDLELRRVLRACSEPRR